MRHFLPSKLYINYLRKKKRKSCIFGLLYCQSKYCKVYGHNDISQKLGIQETCFDPHLIGNLFKHPQELFPLEIAKGLVTSNHHCPSTRPDEELVSCSPGSIGGGDCISHQIYLGKLQYFTNMDFQSHESEVAAIHSHKWRYLSFLCLYLIDAYHKLSRFKQKNNTIFHSFSISSLPLSTLRF